MATPSDKPGDRPRYCLTFEAQRQTDAAGREIPPTMRVKHLLKYALRGLALKCLDHVEVPPDKKE
jgi:hypothetical protein